MYKTKIGLALAAVAVVGVVAVFRPMPESVDSSEYFESTAVVEDRCIPQDSGVLRMVEQRVNHIMNPECEQGL